MAMQFHRTFDRLPSLGRPVVCAIGMFDGFHLGHQKVIEKTLKLAQDHGAMATVLTFQNHPESIVGKGSPPPLIHPSFIRERLFERTGLDLAWVVPFDAAMSQVSALDFANHMATYAEPLKGVVAGDGFRYGRGREGNLALLEEHLRKMQPKACVRAVPPCEHSGEIVSSTRIRRLITEGKLEEAHQLLGRTYLMHGTVIRGDGLGRTLGFPTANLDMQGLVAPPNGVYAVRAKITSRVFNGVMNIGYRPTLKKTKPARQIEIHFPGETLDLYDQPLQVAVLKQIRQEKAFPSMEGLKHKIANDLLAASPIQIEHRTPLDFL